MSDGQLSFRKSANIDRVTDKRKDSLFRLVDTDGSGTIDAQEFAVLYDAIKKDLAEELEKEAQLQKEASSARRRFKMLLLFVAVLVSFLAASVAANFAVIFTVVDQAITTTTTSTGLLEVKGTDAIAKTATATQDVPLIVAPALDVDTLSQVKSLKLTYRSEEDHVEASMTIVAVRKHNATFVEFITDVEGETVEALNGVTSYVRYPTMTNLLEQPVKYPICSANATCSAFRTSGIDVDAATDMATDALIKAGFLDASRHLQYYQYTCSEQDWVYVDICGFSWRTWAIEGWCAGQATIPFMMAIYHPASSNRNIVFFAHGKGQYAGSIWVTVCMATNAMGTLPIAHDCPMLTRDEFKPLLFAFMSSNLTDSGASPYAGAFGWSTDVTVSDYAASADALSVIFCGTDTSFADLDCNFNAGMFSQWVSSPKIMVVGFSDGGGFGMYLNYYYDSYFVQVTAIDYWAFSDYAVWLTEYPIDPPKMKARIYTACESPFFQGMGGMAIFPEPPTYARMEYSPHRELAVAASMMIQHPTFPKQAGMGWYPTSSPYVQEEWGNPGDNDPMFYKAYKFSDGVMCGGYITYAVHGLPSSLGYFQAGSNGWDAQCSMIGTWPSNIHVAMSFVAPVYSDMMSFKGTMTSGYKFKCKMMQSSKTRMDRPVNRMNFRGLEEQKDALKTAADDRSNKRELRGDEVRVSKAAKEEVLTKMPPASSKGMEVKLNEVSGKSEFGIDDETVNVMIALGLQSKIPAKRVLTDKEEKIVPLYMKR